VKILLSPKSPCHLRNKCRYHISKIVKCQEVNQYPIPSACNSNNPIPRLFEGYKKTFKQDYASMASIVVTVTMKAATMKGVA